MQRHSNHLPLTHQRGIVLPMALVMLVIISFAGLLAARNSATFEQFSNNMRTTQVARVSAEDALRQCERIAKAKAESEDDDTVVVPDDAAKILETNITADDVGAIKAGIWNTKANWAKDADNLITITPTYGGKVQDAEDKNPRLKNSPTCIIQTMTNDRFLVTARGLSNDAVVGEADEGALAGVLKTGSEVWLQSILTPAIPMLDPDGGQK